MGIMYKLMKHKSLNTDIHGKPSTKKKSDKCYLLTTTTTATPETTMMNTGHNSDCDVTENDNDVVITASGGVICSNSTDTMRKIEMETEKRFTAEHILQLCKFLAEKSKRNKNLHKQQQSPKKLTKTLKSFQFQSMDNTNDDSNDNEGSQSSSDMEQEQFYDNQCEDEFMAVRRKHSYQNQAIPLLSHTRITEQQRLQQQQQHIAILNATNNILSSRLSPDINAMNISAAVTTTTAYHQQHSQQYHHQQQPMDQDSVEEQHYLQQPQHNGKRDILLKIRHQIFERKRLREKGYEPQSLNGSAAAQQVWRPW
uniref:Uncharacterized protein n=1 Tax=Musca domestica TaxID=7370 RepID=A0A1I8NKC0_MUSDO